MNYTKLKKDTIYRHGRFFVDFPRNTYIGVDDIDERQSGFVSKSFAHYPDDYEEVTPEEAEWVRECIKQSKFIPFIKKEYYELY